MKPVQKYFWSNVIERFILKFALIIDDSIVFYANFVFGSMQVVDFTTKLRNINSRYLANHYLVVLGQTTRIQFDPSKRNFTYS